jgi:hypothetical protein
MRPLAKQILTYLALVFTFSSLPVYVMVHSGHVGAGDGLVAGLMVWCPAFAALTTCWLFRIDLATLGWNWRPAKYEAWAYFIPIIYALPVYIATWALIPGSFAFAAFAARLEKLSDFRNILALQPCCWLSHALRRWASSAAWPTRWVKKLAGGDFCCRDWFSKPVLPSDAC